MSSLVQIWPNVLPIPLTFSEEGCSIPVDWNLVQLVEREASANDTIELALSILTQTVFRGGFTFILSELGVETDADTWFQEHCIDAEWLPTAQRMLRHLVYFGFVCLTFVQSPRCGELVPRVLDTSTYNVSFRFARDGGRRYTAFATMPQQGRRQGIGSAGSFSSSCGMGPYEPLENARLFFASEPDAQGRIVSPLQSVLPSLLLASEMWANLQDADRERTHPVYIYEQQARAGSAQALQAGSAKSMGFGENDVGMEPAVIKGDLNAQDRAQEAAAVAEARRQNAPQLRASYDRSSGSVQASLLPQPWEKWKTLPIDKRLVQPPVPEPMPYFIDTMRVLSSRLAGALGVPLPLLGETGSQAGAGSSSGYDASLGVLRDSALMQQRSLGTFLSQAYMDVYREAHQQEFDRDIVALQLATKALLVEDEVLQLQRRYFVRTRFRNAPAFRFDDVLKLRENRIIGRDTAQQLALGVFNLPADMALSRDQERQERMDEARDEADAAELMAAATETATSSTPSASSSSSSSSTTAAKKSTAEASGPAQKRPKRA